MRVLLGVPFHRAQRWRRTKGVLERTLRDRPHAVFCDACRHELHDQCEKKCKYCGKPCLCRCNKGEDG